MKIRIAALSVAAVAAAQIAFADTPANIVVEGRGLPQVQGIVRDNSKVEWGFVNFVAFGPNWAYTAQDYAAKEHKKEPIDDPAFGRGLLFTAKIWAGSRGLSIREEFYDVSKQGEAKAHVRWKIASLDGKPMALERAYIRFPLPLSDFAGGTVSGKPIPAEYGQEWIGVGEKGAIKIVSKEGAKTLGLSVSKGNPVLWDGRKDKQERFELRVDFPLASLMTFVV